MCILVLKFCLLVLIKFAILVKCLKTFLGITFSYVFFNDNLYLFLTKILNEAINIDTSEYPRFILETTRF